MEPEPGPAVGRRVTRVTGLELTGLIPFHYHSLRNALVRLEFIHMCVCLVGGCHTTVEI